MSPKFSFAEMPKLYQAKIVRRRLSPKRLLKKANRNAKDWGRLMEMAPGDLSDILAQIKRGQFDVKLEHNKIDLVTNRIVIGILTASLFVGSSLILSFNVPPLIQSVSLVGAAGYVVSITMGIRLVIALRKSGNLSH